MKKPVLIAAAAAMVLTGCGSTVPAGQQALEVSSWGAPTLGNCVPEENWVGTFTVDLRRFPSRAITWDANNEKFAERGPYTALSKPKSPPLAPGEEPGPDYSNGQAEMAVPITIVFDLTTKCDDLKKFYRDYATRDSGWLNDNGSVSDGWLKLLTYTVDQPAQQTVMAVNQKYPWQKIWNDPVVREEYKNALQDRLPKDVAARTGGQEFFTNFVVTVGQPYPTDQRLRDAMALEQSAQAEANAKRTQLTAEANAQKEAAVAQQQAAEAQKAAEIAKAGIKQAEIAAFPDVEAYLKDQCMRTSGCAMYNPPTFVLPPGLAPR